MTIQKTGITFQNDRQRTFYAFCPRKMAKSEILKTWEVLEISLGVGSSIKSKCHLTKEAPFKIIQKQELSRSSCQEVGIRSQCLT